MTTGCCSVYSAAPGITVRRTVSNSETANIRSSAGPHWTMGSWRRRNGLGEKHKPSCIRVPGGRGVPSFSRQKIGPPALARLFTRGRLYRTDRGSTSGSTMSQGADAMVSTVSRIVTCRARHTPACRPRHTSKYTQKRPKSMRCTEMY